MLCFNGVEPVEKENWSWEQPHCIFCFKLNIWIFDIWHSLQCIAYKHLHFWGWTLTVEPVDNIIHFCLFDPVFCPANENSPSFLPVFYCWHLEESNKLDLHSALKQRCCRLPLPSSWNFLIVGFYFNLSFFIIIILIIICSVGHFILCVVALFKGLVVQCYREVSAVLM